MPVDRSRHASSTGKRAPQSLRAKCWRASSSTPKNIHHGGTETPRKAKVKGKNLSPRRWRRPRRTAIAESFWSACRCVVSPRPLRLRERFLVDSRDVAREVSCLLGKKAIPRPILWHQRAQARQVHNAVGFSFGEEDHAGGPLATCLFHRKEGATVAAGEVPASIE